MADTNVNTGNASANNSETELIEPFNPTDPIVILDPTIQKTVVAKLWDKKDNNSLGNNSNTESTKYEGIKIPVIQLNNRVLETHDIIEFKLYCTDFFPEIELLIKDTDGLIKSGDVPGLNNQITVVLTNSINGTYKKISVDFYITEYTPKEDNEIFYKGIYKCIPFMKAFTKNIGNKLSTFDMLKQIATEVGLGFAATEDCEAISDNRERIILNKNYGDFIKEQIKMGGLDEKSLFDCWIDLYDTITLINVPWVLDFNVQANQLVHYANFGVNGEEFNGPEQKTEQVLRLITNKPDMPEINNMFIESYDNQTKNSESVNEGTLTQYYYVHPYGIADGCNSILQHEIAIQEHSIDGLKTDEYEFKTKKFLGFEMCETPILMQQEYNKKFFQKIRATQLIIKLQEPNYALIRGMLINVLIVETSLKGKASALANEKNMFQQTPNEDYEIEDNTEEINENSSIVVDKEISDGDKTVANIGMSDMYYIDATKYEYDNMTQSVKQYLYCIKRGGRTNNNNKYTTQAI